MSAKSPFDDWSREEKEEYANQRMNQMRELNEKLMKRHQEVNQDRMDFERENPSAKVLPHKKDPPVEEKERRPRHSEKRTEREWDAGKNPDGDWTSDHQDFRYPRSNRREGHYDEKRNRKVDSERRENPYGSVNRRSGNSRGMNSRNSYPTQNAYRRASGRYAYKSNNSSNRDYKNWNNDSRRQQYSATFDNDKVWRNDELNEARNKQSRVEDWVQSVSTECWTDSDEYSNPKKESNSKAKTMKHDKKYEDAGRKNPHRSYNRRQNQEKIRKSSTSDSSLKEDGRSRYDSLQTHRQTDHTSNVRESDQRYYPRDKFKNHHYNNRSPEYRSKAGTSSNKQRDYVDNRSCNNPAKENKKFQNNKARGNWHDKSDIATKTAWGSAVSDKESATAKTAGKGGTWSDQEDNNQVGEHTSKEIASGWDQGASVSAQWENPKSAVNKNSQRLNKSASWNNQKYSKTSSNYKANQRSQQTSSGIWSDQDSEREPEKNKNRNLKKSNKKDVPWEDNEEHINHRLLRMAYGEKYSAKKEIIDLCSDSDTEYVSKNKNPEKVSIQECEVEVCDPQVSDVQMSDVQECEVQECELEKNKASSSVILTKQQDSERFNVQVSDVQMLDIQDGDIQGSKTPECSVQECEVQECVDFELQKSPGQKSDDQETFISLEVTEDDYFLLENLAGEATFDDSIEKMRCEVTGSDSISTSLFPSTYDIETRLLNDTPSDISLEEKDLTIESVPGLEKFLEGIQYKVGHSEYLEASSNENSPNTLRISVSNNEQREIQLINEAFVEIPRDFSNSLDLLEEPVLHELSMEGNHSTGINSSTYLESSGNAKHLPEEIGSSSKEIQLNCPRHSKSSLELEANLGALTDDDGENDWSTITDENDSDTDEREKVDDPNVNKNGE